MIDDKISADSHHYQQLLLYSFTPLCISDKLVIAFFFQFRENLNVNDALMELFILAYACKTACARRIIGMYRCTFDCKLSSHISLSTVKPVLSGHPWGML